MNVADIVILIALALGAVAGFKAGVIKKTVDFLGIFIIIILSFYLKNYLSVLMYENLPFFSFGGFIKGIEAVNVLLYEAMAFFVVFIGLLFILKVLLLVTGLVEKILKATVILSIPSKILGIIVGAIEAYVYVFLALVILTLPIIKIPYVRESKISDFMLNNTPILSGISEEMIDIYGNVYTILTEKDNKSNEELNEEVITLLIDKKVLSNESAKKLVEKNKIHINDINFVKLDVDNHSNIAREYGVMSIPTIILFKNGKEVKRFTGFMSKDDFINYIN